ncbi:MAG: RHS repeat-associated core domain-containing protein [Anaerohalosphaeraceae bacterium]
MRECSSLSLYHRCLCVLLAYVFLIGPECLVYLSQAATQYSQISMLAWGRGNSIITYGYDANGSLTSKTTTSGGQTAESVVYTYNLQNRLARVETTPYTGGVAGTVTAVDYAYNPDGIRVGKTETTPAGTTATAYLVDPANPTGYAQVLEETTARYDAADVLRSVERTDYVIGEDVISQTKSNCDLATNAWTAGVMQYLLYDGHGSTRQLMNANLTVQDSYSYDGYGVMLGSAAGSANAAQTNLLYCGEQYDSALSQYYLRARYYDPANGLFNQLDPYAGNMQDPQSLHKYLYCHANPVNNVDPTGEFIGGLTGLTIAIAIGAVLTNIGLTVYSGIRHKQGGLGIAWSVIQNIAAFVAIAGAILLSGPIAIAAALTLVIVSIVGIINLIRSWPSMDTTDKVVTAATMLTFIVFAGAIKVGSSPTPEPAP